MSGGGGTMAMLVLALVNFGFVGDRGFSSGAIAPGPGGSYLGTGGCFTGSGDWG